MFKGGLSSRKKRSVVHLNSDQMVHAPKATSISLKAIESTVASDGLTTMFSHGTP